MAARMAHNHEVPGSSPGPATKTSALQKEGFCFGNEASTRLWDASVCWQVPGSLIPRQLVGKTGGLYLSIPGPATKKSTPLTRGLFLGS